MLLFGEEVPFTEIPNAKKSQDKKTLATIAKTVLIEYATPILTTYSQKLDIAYKKLIVRKTRSKR